MLGTVVAALSEVPDLACKIKIKFEFDLIQH
jgi:hypothetical protein